MLDEAVAAFYERSSQRVKKARDALESELDTRRKKVLDEHAQPLADARTGWEQATKDADEQVDRAWDQVHELLDDPLAEARTIIDEAWESALKEYLEPAWERADELLDTPREEARQKLDEVREQTIERVREAWKAVEEAVQAIEDDLDEELPDVEPDDEDENEFAPPLGEETPEDVLEMALFRSTRQYIPQRDVFRTFQGRIAGEASDAEALSDEE